MGLWGGKDWGPEIARIAGELAQLRADVARLGDRIERGSTVAIRADLDNLTGRVESLAATSQKSFGRLFQQQRAPIQRADNGQIVSENTGDQDLDELLAIQAEWGRAGSGERH